MEAVGARWPDNSYVKSVGWSVTSYPVTLGTGTADTRNGFLFTGSTNHFASASNTPPITNQNLTFVSSTPLQTLPADIARWRITSWGLRITGLVAPLSAGGMVRVRLFSPKSLTSLQQIIPYTTFCDAAYDIPVARLANKDLFIIPAPTGIEARQYNTLPASANLASSDSYGWQSVLVTIDGVAVNSAICQISAFYNYEFVFDDNGSSHYFSQPPPPNSLTVREANASVIEKVGNFFEGAAKTLDSIVQSRAAQYVGAAAASYVTKSPAPLMSTALATRGRVLD